MMDLPEFEDLLDRLGDDLSNWPTPQQQAATVLLDSSKKARDTLAEALRLRAALQAEPVRAPVGLADRIFRRAKQMDQQSTAASERTSDDGDRPAPLVFPG